MTTLMNRSQPLRVAFCGPAGSGKTTQAQLLRQKYKGDCLSFASPLKKVTRELFGEAMDDPTFARKANQQVGVLCRNVAGPNIWVDKLVAKVSPDRNCFVDDLRFPSEYYALKNLGFIIVKLNTDETTRSERRPEMTPIMWAHESEQSWVMLRSDFYCDTSVADETAVHRNIVLALDALTKEPIVS